MASAQGTAQAHGTARAHGANPAPGTPPTPAPLRRTTRARDWAEIQERMLVPLYEAVHERLAVGPATSLLGLGCRSGLALLLAAARGAQVAGLEPDPELRELARARGLRVLPGRPVPRTAHSVVTVLDPPRLGDEPRGVVREAARLALPGALVVLATWGPPAVCQSATVLEVARRRSGRTPVPDPFALSGPGALEARLPVAGLVPLDGAAVDCPFAYPDLDSAVRGLLATGYYDAAIAYSGELPVAKEVAEALHPFTRADGSVRMANSFRYLVARKPR